MNARFRVLYSFGLALTAIAAGLVTAPIVGADRPVYYVALGDSLATGAQPASSGVVNHLAAANGTNRGYVDVLHAALREAIPGLQLRNFGCGGEGTVSMIEGGFGFDYRCGYGKTSQLDEAVEFLDAHAAEIAVITIDIGANDLLSGGGVPDIEVNLPVILDALRDVAGSAVPIVAMNYYDPFVAPVWFATHDLDQLQAEIDSVVGFNDFLEGIYSAAGVRVADIETAFTTRDLIIGSSGLPRTVERACAWTWICEVGDIHANDAGYQVIADTFLDVIQP